MKMRKVIDPVSSFQKFSSYIWTPPHSSETWMRLTLSYQKIEHILAGCKAKGRPTTITAVITTIMGRILVQYPELTRYIRGKKIKHSLDNGVFVITYFKSLAEQWDLSGVRINDCHEKSLAEVTSEIRQKSRHIKQQKDGQVKRFSRLIMYCPHIILSLLVPMMRWLEFRLGFNTEKIGFPGNRFGSIMITALHEFGVESAKIPLHRFCNTSFIVAICAPFWQVTETGKEKRLPLDITLDHRVTTGKSGAVILQEIERELDRLML